MASFMKMRFWRAELCEAAWFFSVDTASWNSALQFFYAKWHPWLFFFLPQEILPPHLSYRIRRGDLVTEAKISWKGPSRNTEALNQMVATLETFGTNLSGASVENNTRAGVP